MKLNKYQNQHIQSMEKYLKQIKSLYYDSIESATQMAESIQFNELKAFRFKDYPQLSQRADALFNRLNREMNLITTEGINTEWESAMKKNDDIVSYLFGKENVDKFPQTVLDKYFSHNDDARIAFMKRNYGGVSLSDRVWKYTKQFKQEIEMGIDVGLMEGKPASKMATEMKQYLNAPDKLFRRVRNARGVLQLSKNALAYHPGQGVYRSSYKNAYRMARTEINMAYQAADAQRWKQLDFVVGIRVNLSAAHPKYDICDEMVGDYPKEFKFTSWHPACICYATPILKTEKEIADDTTKLLQGKSTNCISMNKVYDTPKNFKKWIVDHKDYISKAKDDGKLPYFIRNNKSFF